MQTIDKLIDHILKLGKPHVYVEERKNEHGVYVSKENDLTIEIVIPKKVLEWFVTVRIKSTNEKQFTQWFDYYPIENETQGRLEENMCSDIIDFITGILDTDIRIDKKRKKMEWYKEGIWVKVWD